MRETPVRVDLSYCQRLRPNQPSPTDGQALRGDTIVAVADPEHLTEGFNSVAIAAGLLSEPVDLRHETLGAPHRQCGLPSGFGAVYVFSLADRYVEEAPGRGRVLKVGRVGPRSDARFRSQHYNPKSSGSNLAKTLLSAQVLWPYLGIEELTAADVKDWILSNTDRNHLFVSEAQAEVLPILETYVRGVLGPVFEGG